MARLLIVLKNVKSPLPPMHFIRCLWGCLWGCLVVGLTGCFQEKPASQPLSLDRLVDKVAILTPSNALVGLDIDFGSIALGKEKDFTYELVNSGASSASKISLSTSDPVLAPFEIKGGTFPGTGGNCPDPIPAGVSCSVVFTYRPTSLGPHTGTTTIAYYNGVIDAPLELTLSGNTTAGLTLSESPSYHFGSHSAVASHTFNVTNNSFITATNLSLSLLIASPAFTVTANTCTGNLNGSAPGNTCNFTIQFTSGSPGISNNTVKIEFDNGTESDGIILPVHAISPGWKGSLAATKPSARFDHSAIWTGSQMIIWGGQSNAGGTKLGEGYRYDPTTDTWSAISLGHGLLPRSLHTAIWTGSKMIIWGGQDLNGNALNDGAIYDPALNQWSAISTLGQPSARFYHSAVWDPVHSQMIIFGGLQSNPALQVITSTSDLAFAYSPEIDSENGGTWSSLSTTNIPSGRYLHSATFFNSKMMIWGGCLTKGAGLCTTESNTGSLYDIENDSWSSVSTTSAPSARFWHTAIWSGSRVMVWAGTSSNGTVDLNSGGQYNPENNTWSALSTTGDAPLIRRGHLAFWTGTQMLIWGGFSDAGHAQLFDPLNGVSSWKSLSLGANPDHDPANTLGAAGILIKPNNQTDLKMMFFGGRNNASTVLSNQMGILFP